MKSYLNAKLLLFREILEEKTSIILDRDINQYSLIKKIAKNKKLKIFEISKELKKIRDLYLKNLIDFRIKNLAMAIIASKICGLKDKYIYPVIKKLKDVNGRLELIKDYPNKVKVFIDYAHTPDALLKAIKSLKNNYGNNISLVFGCGGDRDKKKDL